MRVVDTNVVSELMRSRPSVRVHAALAHAGDLAMSVITIEEVMFGLTLKPNERMEHAFETFVRACSVLSVTQDIARRAATLRGSLGSRGLVRQQPDMLIAATVAQHNATLLTRNVRDFDGCGIRVVNPFA